MRAMTSEEMMQANGGRYRWKCAFCGRMFITKFATTIHCKCHHGTVRIIPA
ncbi:MAG: hypothetical protein J5501_06140 [Ruminococcus sp.]|nr:hypothetical protein [Ruminococcus sp.]